MIVMGLRSPELLPSSQGLTFFLALMCFANVAWGIGVWNWKKWGVYGYFGSALLALAINLSLVGPGMSFSGLAGPVLMGLLVRPLWKNFE